MLDKQSAKCLHPQVPFYLFTQALPSISMTFQLDSFCCATVKGWFPPEPPTSAHADPRSCCPPAASLSKVVAIVWLGIEISL